MLSKGSVPVERRRRRPWGSAAVNGGSVVVRGRCQRFGPAGHHSGGSGYRLEEPRPADVLRAQGVQCLEVTAHPHARGFYTAAGLLDCGVAETDFGAAPRMRLAIC